MDGKSIGGRLDAAVISALSGAEARVFESLGSTNDAAKELAASAPEGFAVLAERQTAGRGRRGRTFVSPPGGLYMSVVLRPKADAARLPMLTAASAVAVADAIEAVCGESCAIKWVNDLYLRGRKVCGILAEAVPLPGGGIGGAVVGVGVNFCGGEADVPAELRGKMGFIFGGEPSAERSVLAAEIIKNLLKRSAELESAAFLGEYRRRCFVPGRWVEFTRGGEVVRARAVGIDESCALVVETADGKREALSAGEVSVAPM